MEVVYGLIVAALIRAALHSCQDPEEGKRNAIGILNLFAGWTAIGWIGALVWAA